MAYTGVTLGFNSRKANLIEATRFAKESTESKQEGNTISLATKDPDRKGRGYPPLHPHKNQLSADRCSGYPSGNPFFFGK